MADSFFRKIDRNADIGGIKDYLDYLANRLNSSFDDIGIENLSDELKNKIDNITGGENERRR